jgi:hypothetical protein
MDVDSQTLEEFLMKTPLDPKSEMKASMGRSSNLVRIFAAATAVSIIVGCAGGILKYENSEKVLENKEFDSAIQVRELPDPSSSPETSPSASPTPTPSTAEGPKSKSKSKRARKPKPTPKPKATPKPVVDTSPKPRQPVWENDEGFVGRRPVKDPYHVGEQVVLDISYWGLDAGELTMQTRSFVEVNGKKAYRFHAIAKTVSVFENFYKVNDYAETLVDFETLLPVSYTLDVKESKLLRDARAVHDLAAGEPGKMQFWDKKITKDSGVEERKMEWEMLPYSQNIFSSLWYLRAFKLTPGKKIKFNVAHENENITITCEVLRREKLSTKVGELDTVVIRPTAEKDGQPKSIGQNLFWLTDDDSKLMVRMETKIKIGSIVGSLQSLKR